MIASLPPGLILLIGAFIAPLLPNRHIRSSFMILLPLFGIWQLIQLEPGTFGAMAIFGFDMVHVRVDKLSLIFGYIFYIAAFLGIIFALHKSDRLEETAALAYMGSAIGATFAGDLITLFVYWELTAIASVFIVWAGRTPRAYKAGQRYLIIQITSGVLLAAGAVIRANEVGSVAFNSIGPDSPGGLLILLAFGIKAAFPLLHNWLQDSYPEASETGTVYLSAFTTKLAIYALARGFSGTEILIWIGVAMTAFPIFYAVIENDLRRVLAYSLNNQVGFMVTGVGIGTELALNGAAAHAFAHILYKALLLMSMGAVLLRTGTVKGSELGGLYKTMPLTTSFCIVGSASISAFPLFSGFVTKTMILVAASEQGLVIPYLVLLFASAGVFHHSGIKIPFFAFFAHDSGKRPQEAPINMLISMALTSLLCIGIGVYPDPLYTLLPFPVYYEPYTLSHVISDLQLLMFSALAFSVLQRTGLYPPELRSTVLDSDWVYRKPAVWVAGSLSKILSEGLVSLYRDLGALIEGMFRILSYFHGSERFLGSNNVIGASVAIVVTMLAIFVMVIFSQI